MTLDNLSRGHADAVIWGPLVVGELRDGAALRCALVEHRVGAVTHFAALADVGDSVTDPRARCDNNLAKMRQVGLRRIVPLSSCATCGYPDRLPMARTCPQLPVHPDGRTKLVCDWMLRAAGQAWGLRHAALRHVNAAGADPETLLALAHLLAGGDSLAVTLGTGRGTSVREIVAAVERVTTRPVPLVEEPRRAGGTGAGFSRGLRAGPGACSFTACAIMGARRSVAPDPEAGQWRVAMVTTKTPSEPFAGVRETLLAMRAQDPPQDTRLAAAHPTGKTRAWCAAQGVRISSRKGQAGHHRAEWPRRTLCKEGNLAFFHDHGGHDGCDIVCPQDADHVPIPGDLRKVLRPFADPLRGFVSAPAICAANADASWAARTRPVPGPGGSAYCRWGTRLWTSRRSPSS